MISIIDYGLGNVQAFLNMYKRMNVSARAVRTADEVEEATKIVLPGVGAFDHAMELFDASGMREAVEHRVREDRVPLIGVCVGMQMLADGSEEGTRPGLGLVPGEVRLFPSNSLPLPHMGWNDIAPRDDQPLFAGLERDARFYFLHSYYYQCADDADDVAGAHYGGRFTCAVTRGNVHGVQFHPEKSHHFGETLLRNFARL